MSEIEEVLGRVLFVGGHGYVTAIDKESGDEIWRTSLKGSGYGFVNVLLEGERIFAASGGKLYCLSADNGDVWWTNSMPGLGYGVYSFATRERGHDGLAALMADQQAKSSQHGGAGQA